MTRASQSVKGTSALNSHTGFWLRFVSNHVSHAFARRLLKQGVTVAEWVVLREMYDKSEISPSVVAEQTGLTRGAISKLIDRLEAKKLVTRRDRRDDRRFQVVGLTSAARRLVPALAAIADRNDEEFFLPLSASEREALVSILKKLVRSHGFHTFPTE
jgi:DNA-binding MarR family transcriptional regulator